MKVFVAGATGVIGRRAVEQLVAAGHEVTAVARSEEKAERLRAAGATPVAVSLFDPAGLAAAVAGHDAVVNLATSIPPMSRSATPGAWRENDRIRTEGAANLVDAALAAGVGRFVQESVTFTYADAGDRWIDATTGEVRPSGVTASTAAAEAAVRRFTEAGGTGIVLRFGMFYAPDSGHTRAMLSAARWGVALLPGRPGARLSAIHADDAAAAVVAALAAPAGTWDVVDDEPLTRQEVARALGARVRVPGRWATLLGGSASALARSQRVSNRRFREATGWAPPHRSVRDGLAAMREEAGAAGRRRPRRRLPERLVRPGLGLLAATTVLLGVWATAAPRSFYDDFPPGPSAWVAPDGPYNEHLVRDVGGLNLALSVLLLAAAWRPERLLVRVAALAYLVFAVPHLAYHARNLDVLVTGDAIAVVVTLALAVAVPAVLVLGTATTPAAGQRPRATTAPLPGGEPAATAT